jgi:hypothetical protein
VNGHLGIVALAAVVIGTAPIRAADVAFGADGLSVLIDEADSVIEAGRIELVRRDHDAVLVYSAVIGDTIAKKRMERGRTVLFAVPRLATLEETPPDGAVHVLFLSPPVDAETAREILRDVPGPLHWLTGGHYGRIDRSAERIDAIQRYARLGADDDKLTWAQSIVRSRDELLQRSALIELAKPQYADNDVKYALLAATAVDSGAAESTKDLAVQLLEISESPRALTPLRDIAIADVTPEGRRRTAMLSVGRIPGGEAVLRDLSRHSDPTIQDLAGGEIERLLGPDPTLPSPASVLSGLSSPEAGIRSRAIYDLGRVSGTTGTLPVVVRLLGEGATTNVGERAILIDHLASLNTTEAAEALAAVTLDMRQPEALRNAAILALADMNPSVSGAVLRQLATGLEDGALRELAELLAD